MGWLLVKNKWLIICAFLLTFSPLLFLNNTDFPGSDSISEQAIAQMNPDYQPWFHSIFKPSSAEVESLLFALQAAIGAGFIGYGIGLYKGRKEKEMSEQ